MTDAPAATAAPRPDAQGPGVLRVDFPAPALDGRPTGVEDPARHVALVTLDRPAQLNALNDALLMALASALERLDTDPDCRCVVITGAGERAFAAGADIKELIDQTTESLVEGGSFDAWDRVRRVRKPLIAAVRGYALGGGCELAMACDMIVAGDDAQFGQPEIKIGVIPGAGGTQRLTRAVGKARAMELILTGRPIDAREADALGLLTSVVPAEATLAAALALAGRIAAMPPLAVIAAKEAVRAAFEGSLTTGLESERRLFFGLFGSDDQREGMAAFIEKRTPRWSGR